MKKIIFIYFFICLSLNFNAQFSAFTWSSSTASATDEAPFSMAVDSVSQFIYTCGFFSQNNAFTYIVPISKMNNGAGNNGKSDAYICKYDFLGNLIWMTNIGSTDNDVAMDILLAPNGNLYLTGYYKNAAQFNSVSSSSLSINITGTDIDAFTCCYNSSGNVLWAKTGGGSDTDKGHAITAVSNGIWVSGYYDSFANFGVLSTNSLYSNKIHTFLIKYDFSGNEQFLCEVKSNQDDLQGEPETMEHYNIVSYNDTVFAVGIMGGNNLTFINAGGIAAPGTLSNGDGDENHYIVSFSNLGQLIWLQQIENNTGLIHGCGIAADCKGVYVSGTTHDNSVFPSFSGFTLNTGDHDNPFVVKLFKTTGYKDWVHYWSTTTNHYDIFSELFTDFQGNLYAIGSLKSNPSLQPDANLSGVIGQDIVVVKLTTSGTFQWAKLLVGTSDNFSGGFWCNASYFFLGGNYYTSINLQTALSGPNNQNIFLVKGTMAPSYTPNYCCNIISAAVAGPTQTICTTTTTLAGNTPTAGLGMWSIIGGTVSITTPTSPVSVITGVAFGTNSLQWTISGGCSPSTSTVTVQRDEPPSVALAGNNKITCLNTATLAANIPAVGSGSWSVLSGTVTITNPFLPTTDVTNITVGNHSLKWNIINGVCLASNSIMFITRNQSPAIASAGLSQSVCSSNATLSANVPLTGLGSWSVTQGSATISSIFNPYATVTNLYTGLNSFVWSVSTPSCGSSSSTVNIQVDGMPSAAYAGTNVITNSNVIQLSANTPTLGIGTWVILSGGGIFSDQNNPIARFTDVSDGDNILAWQIRNGSCSLSEDTLMIIKNGLFIPELITPNSDGNNDVFYINTLDNYKSVKLEVFNRWGNLVYINEKYNNEFVGKNLNGEKLVDDVYFIIVTIPKVKTYTGYLTIKEN